jgi:hypothetical protein
MSRRNRFKLIPALLFSALLIFGPGLAQAQPGPGGPGGPPGHVGPPDNGEPGNPPFGFVPPGRDPGFVPPGQDRDDDDDEDGNDDGNDDNGGNRNGIPPFCSRDGARSGPDGQAGLSSIAHLNFSQQDPETGDPLEDGAWGRMMYRWISPVFDYVFNGHELPPGEEYTLTYQPQPLPSEGVICLGDGTVNPGGDLHIQDAFDLATDLPAAYDENEDEAILALVLSSDVDCEAGTMTEWQPEDYLFGDETMFYVNPDLDDNGDD